MWRWPPRIHSLSSSLWHHYAPDGQTMAVRGDDFGMFIFATGRMPRAGALSSADPDGLRPPESALLFSAWLHEFPSLWTMKDASSSRSAAGNSAIAV